MECGLIRLDPCEDKTKMEGVGEPMRLHGVDEGQGLFKTILCALMGAG